MGENVFSFEGMTKLEHLQTLQLFVPYNSVLKFEFKPGIRFNELVKLEICCECSIQRSEELRRLWAMWPKLQHLRLKVLNMTYEVFERIEKCKLLRHIDISHNVPCIYNKCFGFIAQGCPELEFLDLWYSLNPVYNNVRLLAPCKKLRCLWLEDLSIIDISLIHRILPNLAELNTTHCNTMCPNDIQKVQQQMKSLNIIWVKSDRSW